MPGSHGSLTKAGKVKQATPKIARTGVNAHSKKIPRVRNRKLYFRRIVVNRYGGQANSMGAQKHIRATQPERERGGRGGPGGGGRGRGRRPPEGDAPPA
jgi:ribosomal protein S30